MRILLATAAALFAFNATPAFAQYGGTPQDQVDGTPGNREMVAAPDDEDGDQVEAPAGFDMDADADPDAGVAGGKPGFDEDYAAYQPDDAGQAGPDAYEDADPNEEEGATWQGEDGRTYCRRSDGTTGLIVGGGGGALIGNAIDGGRRRGTGTIIGGIIGALVGSAVERSASEQSCR
jgi:hypothetical protein